jgi:hypothetical protein
MNGGFVKLYRSIESWEWYTDSNTKSLFLHCLIRANHKPVKWRGTMIEQGSFVSSLESLSVDTGLSIQQVRTSLSHLESTGEIIKKSTNRFTSITVVKWADFQGQDDDDNKQITNKQQTDNKQITTNKKYKNDKNEKNKDNDEQHTPTKSSFGEFGKVKLTPEEHAKIVADGLTDYIARVDAYKASTGKRYSSDYATILNWARKDRQNRKIEPIPDYKAPTTETVDIDTLKERLAQLGSV